MEHVKTIFGLGAQLPFVYQFFDEESVQNSELRNSISRLEAKLINASQLIERSECWCFRYDNIQKLLSYLKNAVYEAELTIEEFKSQRRRAENTDWNNTAGELIENLKNWVTGFKEKVISAQRNLDHFCDQLVKICDSYEIPQNPKKFSRPITDSRPPVVFFGRDNELEYAISVLEIPKSESSSCTESQRKIPVLPIVGMGGIGKTALSQKIYHDERLKSYNKKIWICVPQKFDFEKVLKEMIQCVTKKECNFTNVDLLREELIKEIKSSTVLLVLDDIWSTDWQQLLGPMNEASEGSAIILTTRDREYINCTDHLRTSGAESPLSEEQ
ncbi:hypothetical protein LUZ61_009063 [Rhynchospora tenuis]|uniref:NB-ARC domain-containing protein n=1 Tax=Rhynchospora tenuis TaxID=198213 RepID=A0AAD6EY87_9POAL|nr:hypothetical protein LUZ61_009061 [Rhynchospora tenuis]KAJ3705358.1 hypothetical protein LUZ61_009063 [Rhynchospora tenuis]